MTSNGYNFLIGFFHSETHGPAGNRCSPPWASNNTTLTITPPCQLLAGQTFLFYLIGFFHSETNVKEFAAQPVIDLRPPWASNNTGLTITTPCQLLTGPTFLFHLIGFFHSETNVKELAAQPGIDPRPLGLRTTQP